MRLRATAILALILLVAACTPTESTGPTGVAVTHGPVLGRAGTDHVGVWARTSQPAEFTVFYGTDPASLTGQASAQTALADDNTGWVLIEGLEPGTKYHYEVGLGAAPSGDAERGGSFHTLPDSEAMISELNPEGRFNFRFEFACGNNQNSSGSPIGRQLLTHGTMIDQASGRRGQERDRFRDPQWRLALRERDAGVFPR